MIFIGIKQPYLKNTLNAIIALNIQITLFLITLFYQFPVFYNLQLDIIKYVHNYPHKIRASF